MPVPPVMIYGDDVTHVVTEEGVAYLYKAPSLAGPPRGAGRDRRGDTRSAAPPRIAPPSGCAATGWSPSPRTSGSTCARRTARCWPPAASTTWWPGPAVSTTRPRGSGTGEVMTVLLAAPGAPSNCRRAIAAAAVDALLAEALLTPKPGLVDRRGSTRTRTCRSGAARGLRRGAASLLRPVRRRGKRTPARPGTAGRARVRSAARGERHMLAGTAGVNTHRGALWALGLLCRGRGRQRTIDEASAFAGRLAALPDPAMHRPARSRTAARARLRYGAGGAPGEAAAGFPHVVDVGLPELRASRRRGEPQDAAALNALLAIMASLDDTCVLHRGGPTALAFVHRSRRRGSRRGRVRHRRRVAAGSSASDAESDLRGCSPWAAAPTCSPPRCSSTLPLERSLTMQTLTYRFPGPARPTASAHVGVVALRRPRGPARHRDRGRRPMSPRSGSAPASTASTPSGGTTLERFFARTALGGRWELNDFGATPAVVTLRLRQAAEAATEERS